MNERMSSHVSRVRIENYKCYRQIEVDLAPGINVVIGKNDAGKTALLEVLAFAGKANAAPPSANGPSRAHFELIVERDYFARKVGTSDLPLPSQSFKNEQGLGSDQDFLDWLLKQPHHSFRGQYEIAGKEAPWQFVLPSITTYAWELRTAGEFNRLDWVRADDRPTVTGSATAKIPESDFGSEELQKCPARTFYFRPDNIAPKDSRLSIDGVLNPDGANLAGVLSFLQGKGRIERYLRLVQEVFPQIKAIHAQNLVEDRVDVTLWPFEGKEQWAVRLQDSGRGIAPVLAILYVLFHRSNDPAMIIVDEPQAFLHPEALRRLLHVFTQNPQHQFILATHSPIVVAAAGVEKCLIVSKVDGESTIRSVGSTEAESARVILAEVGASLQDVFGSDGVVWVEGATEALCFEHLLRSDSTLDTRSLTILPFRATGDLTGKHREAIAEIYRRLVKSNALIPPAVAFQFDREERDDQDRAKLEKLLEAPVFFTQRRMYENYLLQAGALAALINEEDPNRPSPIAEDNVKDWLTEQERLWMEESQQAAKRDWRRDVDGAEVLNKLFRALTESRCSYRKTIHGPKLTAWLLEHDSNALDEVLDLLRQILRGLARV